MLRGVDDICSYRLLLFSSFSVCDYDYWWRDCMFFAFWKVLDSDYSHCCCYLCWKMSACFDNDLKVCLVWLCWQFLWHSLLKIWKLNNFWFGTEVGAIPCFRMISINCLCSECCFRVLRDCESVAMICETDTKLLLCDEGYILKLSTVLTIEMW